MILFRQLTAAILCTGLLAASTPNEPPNRPFPNAPRVHALIGARVIVSPGQVIEDATIVIRDGVIEAVGAKVQVPADARHWDMKDRVIHAGLIDLSVPVESPDSLGDSPALHWNDKVRPQIRAADLSGLNEKTTSELRALGFTAALLTPTRGIFRGTAAAVSLAKHSNQRTTYLESGPLVLHFAHGGWGSDGYPRSLMGAMALMRQTWLDAQWYTKCTSQYTANPKGLEPPKQNIALAALRGAADGTQIAYFNTDNEFDLFRVAKIADEFQLKPWVRGSGHEFRRLDAVLATKIPIVLPVNFPEEPPVDSLEDAEGVTLRDLMQWEQAPTNPRRLINAGHTVALTTDRLKKRGDFFKRLQAAIDEGLTEEQALAALTTIPATMLGLDKQLGTIEKGKIANLVVIEDTEEIFGEDREVRDVWIDGTRYEIKADPLVDPTGSWAFHIPGADDDNEPVTVTVNITGKPKSPKIEVETDDKGVPAKAVSLRQARLNFALPGHLFGRNDWDRFTGIVNANSMEGILETAAGDSFTWSATRTPDEDEEEDQEDEEDNEEDAENLDEQAPENYPVPLGAFGIIDQPEKPKAIFIDNATIWTGSEAGIIENGDVIIRNGKILDIGVDLTPPAGAFIIDARGKHLTAGLLDCHTHTGIERGVNEGTQAITSEVRIGDVINPDDINWYRQLAGGLTTANQLHGSANPIGGQNSVVKLRWGGGPDDFRFNGAMAGIKFALGENVKQSNWGEKYRTRYPQSRMGVEQTFRSAFQAAADYRDELARYQKLTPTKRRRIYPPRRDLELDALVEILEGERLIHCHSYRQDEILMLIRVADHFGFTIGTFQHVLEGFKVASEIADHGAGASSFSDWWAYKFEVYDAIPHNGSLMNDVGVTVSFNSDSSELARRMNLEGAKAVRYGNTSREEALNFVTLNPAKQLAIDSRVGSIEKGKDADFVIWSGDPLSTFSRCEQTWIEGQAMFTLEMDRERRAFAASERQRIIARILRRKLKDADTKEDEESDKGDAATTQPDQIPESLERLRRHMRDRELQGYDPTDTIPGECDCGFIGTEYQ